jgi:hypothetical protein
VRFCRTRIATLVRRVAPIAIGAMLLVACGESGPSEAEERAQERYRNDLQEYKSDLKNWKEDQVAYDECDSSMGDFRSEIKELDGRLDVGLTYDEYGTQVGDVSAAYSQSDFGDNLDCLSRVGFPLESALNQYRKAFQIWDECFQDIDCDPDSVTSELQSHWSKASNQIERSDRALEKLEVGPRPQLPTKPTALQ